MKLLRLVSLSLCYFGILTSNLVGETSGLIAYWPADSNGSDVVAGNNAIISGATFVPGRKGGAFSFDGVNDSVTFGNSIGNFGTNDFTISFWIRTTSTRYEEAILQKRPYCNGTSGWDIRTGGGVGTGVLHCALFQNTSGANYNVAACNRPINDGLWHHFVVVRSGHTQALYLDGVFETNKTTSGTTILNNTALMGSSADPCIGVDATQPFTGQLDELKIFSRAITASEVEALYDEANGGPPVFTIQPQDTTVFEGDSVEFAATAASSAPVIYQWRFNGENISGANSSNLILTNVSFSSAGTYSVVASNSFGSVLSSNCALVVYPAPGALSPIAWWQAEGNAEDSVGWNDGTLSGATFAAGKVGQAFSFDGNGASVSFGKTIGNFSSNDFSISFWINTTSTRYEEAIIQKRPLCNGTSGWDIRTGGGVGTGVLHCALFQNTSGVNYNVSACTRPINDGMWHHFVAVRQGPTVTLYLDGSFETNKTTAGVTLLDNNAALSCGSDPCIGIDGTDPFNGRLDEIQIYNRALAAQEVAAIYGNIITDGSIRAPNIVLQPRDQRRNQGNSPTFLVVATGSHPIAYQWYRGGIAIDGATDSALTVSNVLDTNVFNVLVANPYGSVMSRGARIIQTVANGTYSGLFYETNQVRHESSGALSLKVTARGTFSLVLLMDGGRNAISGRLTNDEAGLSIIRSNKSALNVFLKLTSPENNDIVSGFVSDGDWRAEITGSRCVFTKFNPAPQAGVYTVSFNNVGTENGPKGNGYGTVTISPVGNAVFSSFFADSTSAGRSIPISPKGEIPLYIPLYRGAGSFLGWLTLTNETASSLKGASSWIKTGAFGKYYPNGFTNDAFVVGSTYLRPTNRNPINITNAIVSVTGDVNVSTNVIVSSTKATAAGATNYQVLSINPRSGTFTGNLIDSEKATKVPVRGVLLQQQSDGSGYFVSTNSSAKVHVIGQ